MISNELSNIDIINIIKDMKLDKYFGGIYSKNELPRFLRRKKFYIINLQDSRDGDGTHWTVFYCNKPLKSIYFDPFGFIAPVEIQKRITPYIYNDKDIQDFDSTACGYYCIAFIKFLHDKEDIYKSYEAFINLFKIETYQNDKILHDILY